MSSEEENVELVRGLWDAFTREGFEAMLERADPDVEWIPRGGGGRVLRGHDEARVYMSEMAARGEMVEAEAYEFRGEGDRVYVRGNLRTRTADGGIADDQVEWLFTLRNGHLVRAESLDRASQEPE
jgi:ketosteroid isomerase-like protein